MLKRFLRWRRMVKRKKFRKQLSFLYWAGFELSHMSLPDHNLDTMRYPHRAQWRAYMRGERHGLQKQREAGVL